MQTFMNDMKNYQDDRMMSMNVHGDGNQKPNQMGAPANRGAGIDQIQMQQIGNVFYNLLNMLGTKNNDERIIGLSQDLRDSIQSRKFDNLFEGNVPFPG